jgi:ABC-type transport system involved in cytochrome c biogenesis ATPase subunit
MAHEINAVSLNSSLAKSLSGRGPAWKTALLRALGGISVPNQLKIEAASRDLNDDLVESMEKFHMSE